MTPHASGEQHSSPARYECLDLFRAVSSYGIVLYHMGLLCGAHPSLSLLVKMSGSFPVIIMTSFFVLTTSFRRKPGRGFREVFAARFRRIWVPFLIWTILYWLFCEVLIPLARARALSRPPATLLLSGYRHLWFLQFLFVGSILAAPLVSYLARRRSRRRALAGLCFAAALLYEFALKRLLLDHLLPASPPQSELNWWLFWFQAINYFSYAPAGVGVALLAEEADALHGRRLFRSLTVLLAVTALLVYLRSGLNPSARLAYSVALFVALLRPLRRLPLELLRFVAKYTYAIYILHLGVALAAASVLHRAHVASDAKVVLAASLFVFGLCLLAAVLLRSLLPWDWLLPLVPVGGATPRPAGSARGSYAPGGGERGAL